MRINKIKIVITLLVIIFTSPIVIGLGMFVFKLNYGYYPVPFVVKLIYYSFKYQSSHNAEQLVNTHFKINTTGYETNYELKNMLNMPYYVYVKFNPKKEPVTASYQYNGSLKIVVTRNNIVQYSYITNGIHATKDRTGFTDGYYVSVLPFPLKNTTYNNTKLSITVINVDNKLIQYAEDAQVSIVPEIDLDSDIPDDKLKSGS